MTVEMNPRASARVFPGGEPGGSIVEKSEHLFSGAPEMVVLELWDGRGFNGGGHLRLSIDAENITVLRSALDHAEKLLVAKGWPNGYLIESQEGDLRVDRLGVDWINPAEADWEEGK